MYSGVYTIQLCDVGDYTKSIVRMPIKQPEKLKVRPFFLLAHFVGGLKRDLGDSDSVVFEFNCRIVSTRHNEQIKIQC